MINYTPTQWLQNVIKNCLQNLELAKTFNKDQTVMNCEQLYTIYLNFTDQEQQYIHNLIHDQFEANDALLILSYIINNIKIDSFERDVPEYILKGDFDCRDQIMLETQLLFLNNIPYDTMRKIHKKSISCFLTNLDISFPYIPLKKRSNNRIVIITEQLLNNSHAPSLMTLEIASVFQKSFKYNTEIFTCASNKLLPDYLWTTTHGFHSSESSYMQVSYKDTILNVHQYPLASNSVNDYQEMLTSIYNFNPLFVLCIGVNSPIADLPCSFTTVVNLNTVTKAPVSEADIFIRYTKLDDSLEALYNNELQPYQKQVFMNQNFPAIVNTAEGTFSRQDLSLPENKFLVCLVGNRLDTEISPSFRQLMCSILQRNFNIDFVIIGIVHELKEFFENTNYKERIHYLGYCSDLLGVYRILDLYINPERIGGGWSSAIALRAGLPVVTLPNCDVAYNVSESFTVTSKEQMLETILKYASDNIFYNMKHQQALDFASQNQGNKIIDFLSEMLTKIKEALPND